MMTSHSLLPELAREAMAERHRDVEHARQVRAARSARRRSTHRQHPPVGRAPLPVRLVHSFGPVLTALFVLVVLSGAAVTLLLETAGTYHP